MFEGEPSGNDQSRRHNLYRWDTEPQSENWIFQNSLDSTPTGVEPATSGFELQCAIQLRHGVTLACSLGDSSLSGTRTHARRLSISVISQWTKHDLNCSTNPATFEWYGHELFCSANPVKFWRMEQNWIFQNFSWFMILSVLNPLRNSKAQNLGLAIPEWPPPQY